MRQPEPRLDRWKICLGHRAQGKHPARVGADPWCEVISEAAKGGRLVRRCASERASCCRRPVPTRAQARHAVPFWDVTVSVSKSITLFHGGLLARSERARQAGNQAEARHYEYQAGRVWEAIMESNAAALEYLQDEAGLTRTGYHRGTGAETMAELGRWEHARHWVIGSFRQHTSRTGDPQLHVHNLVLAKVVTERDGNWRKLDSKALYRFQGAAAAVAAAVTESALTRMFGVAWVQRRDGHGREIAGISQELMDAFSSRRHTIVEAARKIADQRELEHGRLIRRCSCAPGRLRSTMRRRLRTGSGATSAVRWPAPPASASVSKSDTDRRNRSAF